ncbi:MAG: endonuclease domain-containing protein [Vicinamibacteria bacterium]
MPTGPRRSNRRYCGDKCRWQANSSRRYAAHRESILAEAKVAYAENRGGIRDRLAARSAANPLDPEASHAAYLRSRFKITAAQYQALLEAQGGCALCGKDKNAQARRLHIDHDHGCCPRKRSCGKCIRGLLCNSCNSHMLPGYEALPESLKTWDWLNAYLTGAAAQAVLSSR